jgi:hypothetical protein
MIRLIVVGYTMDSITVNVEYVSGLYQKSSPS